MATKPGRCKNADKFNRMEAAQSKLLNKFTGTINDLANEPHHLFLIDSVGALFSSFLLFVVLRGIDDLIGVPDKTIIYLSAMAAGLWLYSTLCFYLVKKNQAPFIMVMSMANLLYCIVTLGLLILCCPQATTLGKIYFTLETVIVCTLAYFELQVAGVIIKNENAG